MQPGLTVLEKQLKLNQHKQKISYIPIYSFINQVNANLKEYVEHQPSYSWAYHLLYHKKPSFLVTFVKSWIFYLKNSLQAQIMSSLLLCMDIKKLRMFIRLRKYIIQLTNIQMLDEIVLTHEDVITIIHRMFSSKIKGQIINGIKQIFISFKISEAKIYSCVFIEYILSVYDSINSYEQIVMADSKHNQNLNTIDISNFSTITKFNSEFHKDNGLYRKIQAGNAVYTVIETKFMPTEANKQLEGSDDQLQNNNSSSISKNYHQNKNFKINKQWNKQNHQYDRPIKDKKKQISDMSESFNKRNDMRIQQAMTFDDRSSIQCNNRSEQFSKLSLRQLSNRNKQFKERILSSKSSQLVNNEQDVTIKETINIIHSSIVRNYRNKT